MGRRGSVHTPLIPIYTILGLFFPAKPTFQSLFTQTHSFALTEDLFIAPRGSVQWNYHPCKSNRTCKFSLQTVVFCPFLQRETGLSDSHPLNEKSAELKAEAEGSKRKIM